MAINPETRYAGKVAPNSPEYPYGSARNVALPNDGTGTPWEQAIVNDLFGWQQAMLSAAVIVPSGAPDQVGASQYLQAQRKLHGSLVPSIADVGNIEPDYDGQPYKLSEYLPGSNKNGFDYAWDALGLKSEHDGFNTLSPTVPWLGVIQTYADRSGETDPLGAGVLRRRGAPIKSEALYYPEAVRSAHSYLPDIYLVNGDWVIPISLESLKATTAQTYYVNPSTGDDLNDGLTETTAFYSVKKALESSPGTAKTVFLASGKYHYLNGMQSMTPVDEDVNLICPEGVAEMTMEFLPRHWVEDPAFPGLFVAARDVLGEVPTISYGIFDTSINSESGGYKLLPVDTLVNLEGGNVGRFDDGVSKLYCRMYNNSDPNKTAKILYRTSNVQISTTSASRVVYLQNIHANFAGSTNSVFEVDQTGANSSMALVNCVGTQSFLADGMKLQGNGVGYTINCECSSNERDGFNYNDNLSGTTVFDVVEYRCKGFFNGRDTSLSNNGSTIHDFVNIVRVGCHYQYIQNRAINDIGDNNVSFNVGVYAGDNAGPDGAFIAGGAGPAQFTSMWLIGCQGGPAKVADSEMFISPDTRAILTGEVVDSGGTITTYKPVLLEE